MHRKLPVARVVAVAEFERVFGRWARASADGLGALKSLSPINTTALQDR